MPKNDNIYDLLKIKEALQRAKFIRWMKILSISALCFFAYFYLSTRPNVVTIYDPETPEIAIRSNYVARTYAHPTSIESYNSTAIVRPDTRNCGPNFAILVHEPHSKTIQEASFFELLDHLQSDYPDHFRELVVFQEGQFSATPIQPFRRIAWKDDREGTQDTLTMLQRSKQTWESGYYHPFNEFTINDKVAELYGSVMRFTSGHLTQNEQTRLHNMLSFYKTLHDRGSLDTQTAFLERIFRLTERSNDPLDPALADRIIDHIEKTPPKDRGFSDFLIKELGMRGSHAYEISVEGFRRDYPLSRSVDIYGLDDIGQYLASCMAIDSCLEGEQGTIISPQFWLPIQPARDAEMVDNVLSTRMDYKDIPVVSASIATHLPLIREMLCQSGFDSVSLSLSEGAIKKGTTPSSNFFGDIINALRKYGDQLE